MTTDHLWKKTSYVLGLLAVTALFGLIVFAANVEIKDLDLWLHLKMGEHILQHKVVPSVDVLSCTITGQPWVNHEWLFQVVAQLIYRQNGAEGLIAMQVFVVAFTFLVLLFLGYNKERQFSVVFLLLLVMLIYQMRFTIRPDIFSLLFFALYIYILSLHVDKKWSVYALCFIQILWSNMHGFFFMGPLLVLVAVGAEYLKRHARLPWQWNQTGRLNDEEYRRLKRILGIVILASLVNPLTFKGAWYPVGVLVDITGKSRIFFSHIQELKRPLEWGNLFSIEPYPYYKLLILLSVIGFVFNRKKIDIGDFFIWAVYLLISLLAVRNLIFFAFVAYLVCMSNFSNLSLQKIFPIAFREKKFHDINLCLAKVILVVWMLQFGQTMSTAGYFDFDKYELKSEFGGVTQRNYPTKAADFLANNHIKGNFFNDFNSGAYLIGRCYPNIKVFIDGRTEVYGPDFFRYYNKIWGEENVEIFDEAVERYDITGVFINTVNGVGPQKVLSHVYQDKKWALVYFGYDGAVFLKNIPEYKEQIEKFKIDLSKWKAPAIDLQKLGPRSVPPFQYINRAFTLEALGFDDAALDEAREALKIAPGYVGAHKVIGMIAGKRNDYKKAFENFRIAAMFSPGDFSLRSKLGLAYEKLGDWEHAIKQYNAMIKQQPKNPQGYFLLTRAYVGDKQYDKILGVLTSARRLDPRALKDVLEVGDLLYKDGQYELAKKVFEAALDVKKDLARVHHKIGLCYTSMGLKDKARLEFEKGLAIEPKDEELKKSLKAID